MIIIKKICAKRNKNKKKNMILLLCQEHRGQQVAVANKADFRLNHSYMSELRALSYNFTSLFSQLQTDNQDAVSFHSQARR